MKSNNQNGFSAIDIILVIVALGAIGAAVYFAVYHKTTVTKTVTVTKAPATTPTTAKTVPANVLQIPELGVQITLPTTLGKVTYAAIPGQAGSYGLTDATILAQDSSCTAALGPIGILTISTTSQPNGAQSGKGGDQLLSNGKYLVVSNPSGVVCANNAQEGGIESTDAFAIITAIKTATLISN